ncbi:MAG: VWA domain-containing protein [Tissierellia bacterium]|nr:VWA domain-containing protein [Tissierellia bacterium]
MKKDLVEVIFILDRSGSMGGLEDDTIGGYNAMIEKQKKLEGRALISTVLFDDRYELLHDRVDLERINPMTSKEYYVRGTTAILDAMGISISNMINIQKNLARDDRAEKIMFIITTDGMENASREYNYDMVRKMVEYQKEKYGWEFLFLGANIDAIETATRFGIDSDRAANFHSDSEGTALNYEVIGEAVYKFRANNKLSEDWKERIDRDFKNRGSK